MKKVLHFVIAAAVLLAMVAVVPAFSAGEKEGDQELNLGVVIPYEIGWFTSFHTGFEVVANTDEDVSINWQYHDYQADQETQAIQNLITLGVDGINLTAVTPESAQRSAQLANEADIPIQITESSVAQGPGEPFADIDFDWEQIYRTVARGLREDLDGQLNIVSVQGFAGTPPVEQSIRGFRDEISNQPNMDLATDIQYGDYAVQKSLNVMQNVIQSGVDFNVAIGSSQEITDGIIQALKEAEIDLDSVTVVTVNGGPLDVENFEQGELDYALSISPGFHGMLCAANLISYLKDEGYKENIFSPMVWVSQDTWQEELIPWEMDSSWLPVVREYIETGEYKPELRSE